MAAYKTQSGIEKKRKSKKRKARLEVSSSSESDSDSDSDVKPQKQTKSTASPVEDEVHNSTPPVASLPKSTKKESKKKKSKAPPEPTQEEDDDEDTTMTEVPVPKAPSTSNTLSNTQANEDFNAIYLRKITTELADDLDKVREAPDFKASSVPMLIHALKQGGSLFSAEEKRRVVGAVGR